MRTLESVKAPSQSGSQRRKVGAAVLALVASAGLLLGASGAGGPEPWIHAGSLAFEIRDAETGLLIPGKLTVLGARGTPGPRWTRTDLPREEAGLILAYDRVFSTTGTGTVPLPPGSYDVYVSRGLEWDLFVLRGVRVVKGGRATVRATLRHVVDTPGWLSGDFHVHAAMSSDSRVPMMARVFEFVAEGIDMIVSTDHNVVADYAPFIQEAGVASLLTSARGDEITTSAWRHFGAFPLQQELAEAGHGAIPAGGNPAELFSRVRARSPGAVIDVHHPRLNDTIGYFTMGGLDSRSDRATRRGFSFDFDAVEVLNGYQDPDRKSVDQTIADWFSLIDHGPVVTCTGNSDTHHLTYNLAGPSPMDGTQALRSSGVVRRLPALGR